MPGVTAQQAGIVVKEIGGAASCVLAFSLGRQPMATIAFAPARSDQCAPPASAGASPRGGCVSHSSGISSRKMIADAWKMSLVASM